MPLHILPTRTAGAAENMAIDFLLLQRYPAAAEPRFRHYEWRGPAFTFGYSQKIAAVRAQLPTDTRIDLCRRPTGGGVVDHRDDWTYTLVIPRGHPLEELRATQSYRAVHESLALALGIVGVEAKLKPVVADGENSAGEKRSAAPADVCFTRAEIFDVVHARSGEKVAGAAQKRNKHGLLFQGSIWRPAAGGAAIDWETFEQNFIRELAAALGTTAEPTPWPELNEAEVSGLTEQYSSPEWIEGR